MGRASDCEGAGARDVGVARDAGGAGDVREVDGGTDVGGLTDVEDVEEG